MTLFFLKSRENRNWCFISWKRLLRNYISYESDWLCLPMDEAQQQQASKFEKKNVKWNDLSFDIYLYNIYLEMLLRRCRFIFTVIEATTLRSKLFRDESVRGFCCWLVSKYEYLSDCFILLITCSKIDTSFTSLMCPLRCVVFCFHRLLSGSSHTHTLESYFLLSIDWWISC